jgi:deoxyribodipyrimidine photolyase
MWFRDDLRIADHPALASRARERSLTGYSIVDVGMRQPLAGAPARSTPLND